MKCILKSGNDKHTYNQHQEPITSCIWLPDNNRFISSGGDKNVYMWHINGTVLHRWSGIRVTDLSLALDSQVLVAISDKKIRLFQLDTKEEIWYHYSFIIHSKI